MKSLSLPGSHGAPNPARNCAIDVDMDGDLLRMKGSTLSRREEDDWQLGETRLLDVEKRRALDPNTDVGDRTANEGLGACGRAARHMGDGGACIH